MIEIITLTGLLVACGWLSWRVSMLEARLLKERRLRNEALDSERKALDEVLRLQRQCQRTVEINHNLAYQRPMYFADQPTLDATAYRSERHQSPIVWWTYDN